MDWPAWLVWEEVSVDLIANSSAGADTVLAQLRLAVEEVRRWRPGTPSLIDVIRRAFEDARQERVSAVLDTSRLVADVLAAVPEELRPQIPVPNDRGHESEDVKRRFLAAHAFANWTAHLGLGLRSWLRSVEAAHALLVTGYGPGGADLLLRHLSDIEEMARIWSRSES